MKKLIVLILLVGLLLWAVPVAALAEDASGTIGGTSAEVNTQTEAADASASAASSDTTGQAIPTPPDSISAHADSTNPHVEISADSSDRDEHLISNGGGSTTAIGGWDIFAQGRLDDGYATAGENVVDVEVTAPTGFPVKILLKADYSTGESLAEIDTTEGNVSHADSSHLIGGEPATVYLYDNVIVFDSAEAEAEAWIDWEDNADSDATADIWNLRVWDSVASSYTTAGYPAPLNVDSDSWNQADIDVLRAALNAVLAKSNVRITALVWTYTTTNTEPPYAHAHAVVMVAEFLDANGNPVASITICDDAASVTPTHALAQDVEAKFSSSLRPVGGPEGGQPQGQSQGQGTPSQTTSHQGELPVTGANLALYGLLVAGLLGAGITLRRRYTYEPKH